MEHFLLKSQMESLSREGHLKDLRYECPVEHSYLLHKHEASPGLHAPLKLTLGFCLGYFSIAVERHYNQNNL